jgi:hypothetical protein
MRTSLTRALAGVAIATAAAVAVAGAANASSSTSTPRKATTLSIVEAKHAITVGQADTIGGVLKSHGTPLAHRVITLDRSHGKTWVRVEQKFTGKFGGVVFGVKPQVSAAYKLVFLGGDVFAPTHSGVVVVRVNKPRTPTALTIAESASSIAKGSTDMISGGLTADGKALPKHWVWLATVGAKGKIHLLRSRLSSTTGAVTFTVEPAATTIYELVYRGNSVLAPTASTTVITTVTLAPASA